MPIHVVHDARAAARRRIELDQLPVELLGHHMGGQVELFARLLRHAAREVAVLLERHQYLFASAALNISRISVTRGTGRMSSGGILPFSSRRKPSGITELRPMRLKYPSVPGMT